MYFAFFVVTTGLLWLSLFGYPLCLEILVRFRKPRKKGFRGHLPSVGVIVPTLNEERFMVSKMEDLRSTEYPVSLISYYVVDGGS